VEISRTQVFDDPVRGREFFEAVIQENLELGRPDRVQLVFDRKIIGTQFQADKFVSFFAAGGQHDNGYIRFAPQCTAYI